MENQLEICRTVGLDEMRSIKELKEKALENYGIANEHLLDIGRIAEIEICFIKGWKLCKKKNHPGFDAQDGVQNIQIKTEVDLNTTSMMGKTAQISGFDMIALIHYDKNLQPIEIRMATIGQYLEKLKQVSDSSKAKRGNKEIKHPDRRDLSFSAFKGINGLKIEKLPPESAITCPKGSTSINV